ncbi:MAG TPA: hypothetical protein PK156_28655, partial [Polyangium sp.]|nr:hypothetical protein [Polyangium sp.]
IPRLRLHADLDRARGWLGVAGVSSQSRPLQTLSWQKNTCAPFVTAVIMRAPQIRECFYG